uniref:Uncharacterized protein n=1 Tax=Hyaloperonospora arabidopsidis (strain Emoy2) TaxID=559515 RepID=M4BN57_HYAAE
MQRGGLDFVRLGSLSESQAALGHRVDSLGPYFGAAGATAIAIAVAATATLAAHARAVLFEASFVLDGGCSGGTHARRWLAYTPTRRLRPTSVAATTECFDPAHETHPRRGSKKKKKEKRNKKRRALEFATQVVSFTE